jgi:biopolymer transport protein ExbB
MDTLIWILLGTTSLVTLTFILERAWSLRWGKVIPADIEIAVDECREPADVEKLCRACGRRPSPIGRLLMVAADHLQWPKEDAEDAVQNHARHEIVRLERGLIVLEVAVGIAPLLGLVGTIYGMITLFTNLGQSSQLDNAALAKGIGLILYSTLAGLLIAIPALVAWSYFAKKVERLAVEMETLCGEFLRRQYRDRSGS